jgi:hypothetical protein
MLYSRSQSFTTEILDLGGGQTRKLSLTEPELNETMSDVRKLVLDELVAGTRRAFLIWTFLPPSPSKRSRSVRPLEVKLSEEMHYGWKRAKKWRQLCNAAREAKDPDELLKILEQLSKALKREEQARREFREVTWATSLPAKSDVQNWLPMLDSTDLR